MGEKGENICYASGSIISEYILKIRSRNIEIEKKGRPIESKRKEKQEAKEMRKIGRKIKQRRKQVRAEGEG